MEYLILLFLYYLVIEKVKLEELFIAIILNSYTLGHEIII